MRSTDVIIQRLSTLLISIAAVYVPVLVPSVWAEQVAASTETNLSFQSRPLKFIPAGTAFKENPPPGWSNLISFVQVKLTSGDVADVSDTVRYYAEFFNLVMLGNVKRNAEGNFELEKVAVGFSMPIDGRNTIVTADTQSDLGGELSLIGRGVLGSNIEALSHVQQVARTSNSMLVDAPAVFLRSGQHREMIVRHYIWVFPENGNMGTLVWLLDPSLQVAPKPSQMKIADTKAQLLPPNMHEDRVMDVDTERFSVFGIPAKDAFASVSLPPGTAFEMNEAMQRVAAEKIYTAETFAELTVAIAQTLKKP